MNEGNEDLGSHVGVTDCISVLMSLNELLPPDLTTKCNLRSSNMNT